MFQVRPTRCFRCVRQDVSGVPGKMFQVCRSRCFRCTGQDVSGYYGQDVSGAPGKMFQVCRSRSVSGKRWQVRRKMFQVKLTPNSGLRHTSFRRQVPESGVRGVVSGVSGKDSSMSHSTISLLPCVVPKVAARSAVTVCLATQVRGKW